MRFYYESIKGNRGQGRTGQLSPAPPFVLHVAPSLVGFASAGRHAGFLLPQPLFQTVGIDLLGLHFLLRCDLLDVFLSFLQPLFGDILALSYPRVLEVAAELVPEHEDLTGRHFLLSGLWLDTEVAHHVLEAFLCSV